jgi:hypothetical protein
MALHANPSPCGGIQVNCCPDGIPENLVATFTGANVCGNPGSINLKWDSVAGQWKALGAGCHNAGLFGLLCNGTDCTGFQLGWNEIVGCVNTITLTSCACDGPSGFKLVFSVTQNGPHPSSCPCCPNPTTYTVTISPGLPT